MDQTNDDGSEIVVTFGDPNVMECETAFDLAEEQYPREQLRRMLGNPDGTDNGQWDLFWREWRSRQVGDLNELLDDVMKHYGADRGKPARSSR